MPFTHVSRCHAPVPPDVLFDGLCDLARWPEWDPGIAAVEHDGAPVERGTRFVLRPKGGPRVPMRVEVAMRPRRFVDLARLPLGWMRTTHELHPEGAGTRVDITIETGGWLGLLWDRVIARPQMRDAAAQTARLAAWAAAR